MTNIPSFQSSFSEWKRKKSFPITVGKSMMFEAGLVFFPKKALCGIFFALKLSVWFNPTGLEPRFFYMA